jgi:cytidine deaminase
MRTYAELREAAVAAVPRCWCPYSGFRVVAILEDSGGALFTGVNVENASYGLTICAERTALASAIASGSREFSRMLVYSPDGEAMPCGACRQVLAEFCRDEFPVLVACGDGSREYRLGDLLPHSFRIPPGEGRP